MKSESYHFRESLFTHVAKEISRAGDWLRRLGIATQGRIDHYRRELDRFAEAEDNQGEPFARLILDEPANVRRVLLEADEITHIYRGLHGLAVSTGMRDRLEMLVSGPTSYEDEKPSGGSHHSRDYGWELHVGSYLALAGCVPAFGEQGDVAASVVGRRVLVECKRPSSRSQLQRRISEAFSQLSAGYQSADEPRQCRGIVAINATKLINPSGGWESYASHEALDAHATSILTQFVDDYESDSDWKEPADPRTLGMVIYLTYIAQVREMPPILTVVGHMAVSKRRNITDLADHHLMEPVLRTILGPSGKELLLSPSTANQIEDS
jgi:hypothetical protein